MKTFFPLFSYLRNYFSSLLFSSLLFSSLLFSNIVLAQTYSFINNTASNHDSYDTGNNWGSALSKTIAVSGVPTSGMVLRQINLYLGNGTNSNDLSSYAARLKDPLGNTVNIFAASYFYSGGFDQKYTNIKFRDHAALKKISDYGATSYLGVPYYWGYYRVETAGSFANFNTTTNVNGNWKFEMIENVGTEAAFNSVELVFGSPFSVDDISASPTNNLCHAAKCIESSGNKIYIATNQSFPTGQSEYPPLTISSCNWNSNKDYTAWFFFTASATTARVSLSGFGGKIEQSVALKIAGTCASPTYTLVACPDANGANDMFTMQKGNSNCNASGNATNNQKYYRTCYNVGTTWNHEYNLTGLTVGDNYIIPFDGQDAGQETKFYVEISSGASNGCSYTLPVALTNFNLKKAEHNIALSWQTQSELNNAEFLIEKSIDGKDFSTLFSVNGKGTTNEINNYNTIDYSPTNGISYYRLSSVDFDGTKHIIQTKPVKFYNGTSNNNNNLIVEYLPSNIKVYAYGLSPKGWKIIDLKGNVIKENNSIENSEEIMINHYDLAEGIYFIEVSSYNNEKYYEKFIKR